MLKKDALGMFTVKVGEDETLTMAPTANATKIVSPDNLQPAGTKVKLRISTIDLTGNVIKTVLSDEVTLP